MSAQIHSSISGDGLRGDLSSDHAQAFKRHRRFLREVGRSNSIISDESFGGLLSQVCEDQEATTSPSAYGISPNLIPNPGSSPKHYPRSQCCLEEDADSDIIDFDGGDSDGRAGEGRPVSSRVRCHGWGSARDRGSARSNQVLREHCRSRERVRRISRKIDRFLALKLKTVWPFAKYAVTKLALF